MTDIQLPLLIGLLILDLLVTAIRAGLLNIRYPRLISLREKGKKNVEKTIELVTNRAKTRSTLKLTQSILRFLMAGLVLSMFMLGDDKTFNISGITIILVITAVVIWLFEFVIEHQILRNPDMWAVRLTPIANILIQLMSPVVALPLRISKSGESRNLVTLTESELKTLVDASQRAGKIEKDESEMIYSVFELGDTMAREIMIPRVDILTLDVETPLKEAADILLESGLSRIPIYEEQIDNVIGLLYTKDMLKVWRSGNGIDSLRELLRPAKFVPETKKVDELLDEMQAARVHIAIIVDEYGGVEGLVTMEDIIEEIFGEIQDEYDEREEELYTKVGADEYLFDGKIPLDEINKIMGINLPTDEAETLGGLIFNIIGKVPTKGESLTEAGVHLTVEELNERRVHKVRAKIIPKGDDNSPSSEEEKRLA